MTTENSDPDPYAAALADLRAKRQKIDNTIAVLEEFSRMTLGRGPDGDLQFIPKSDEPPAIEETAGMFLGMSIVDAAKKLLAMRKRTMGNVEISRELRAGGLVLTGKDPVNVVGSVMTRRFNDVGDVVKVGRGIWGLKEWYPGRNFKPAGKVQQVSRDDDNPVPEEADDVPTSAASEQFDDLPDESGGSELL